MLYSFNQYLLILESKREDQLRAKYVDKLGIDELIFDDFFYNKNTEWLLKIYTNTSEEVRNEIDERGGFPFHKIIVKYAEIFDNNKGNLDINEISLIRNIDEMKNLLDSLREFDTAEEVYVDDIWVLENSYEWFIFKPKTYEVSELANNDQRTSNWCTTYDEGQFKSYLGPQGGMLYVCNKLDKTKDIALEMKDSDISGWDWEDRKKFQKSSLESIVGEIWEEDEEPYTVLMENEYEIEESIPSVDWDTAREKAKDNIERMELSDIIERYGVGVIYRNVDDDGFFNAIRNDEIGNYRDNWRDTDTTILDGYFNDIFNDDFEDWTEENKESTYKTFKELMTNTNEEDGTEYDVEDTIIDDIIEYVENEMDIRDAIEAVNLEDEVVEKLVDNYMGEYENAGIEDYVISTCGSDAEHSEIIKIVQYYVKFNELSDDIVEDLTNEELEQYME